MRELGGRTNVCSTIEGSPLFSNVETKASPIPKLVIVSAVFNLGLGRNVSAADLTAFWSFGVKARKACCIRFPS